MTLPRRHPFVTRPSMPVVHDDRHDLGLVADLRHLERTFLQRRRVLLAAGAGSLALLGCGGSSDASTTATSSGTTATTGSGSTGTTPTTTTSTCSVIPEETAGPYPGDGSNTSNGSVANALLLSGIVRSDIRSSIAGATGVASGVPLTLQLALVNTNGSCASLAGYAIYLWHCDAQGRYSMYSSGVTGENYLRGVQSTDAAGLATFTTIFPGCYSGRMPHVHFEIYRSTGTASSWSNKLRTSQMAFDRATCASIYAAATGYGNSATNLAAMSFANDNVFSDGVTLQLATLTGSVSAGYTATLAVGIAA